MKDVPVQLQLQLAQRPATAFAQGAHLAAPDRCDNRVWYLHEGLVRLYSLGADGREHIHSFHGPAEWVHGQLSSRTFPECCAGGALGVVALRSTRATAFTLEELDTWCLHDSTVAQFLLTRLMALNAERLQREAALLTRSAEQRYLDLLALHPALVHTVPLQEIAGWLGITPVALSRIRRRVRERGG